MSTFLQSQSHSISVFKETETDTHTHTIAIERAKQIEGFSVTSILSVFLSLLLITNNIILDE